MSLNDLMIYYIDHPAEREKLLKDFPQLRDLVRVWEAMEKAKAGEGSVNDVYGAFGGSVSVSPEGEKYLDNMIARENTEQAQTQEEHLRDTSLTSAGSQLQSLGLSPSSVIQTGGAAANGVGAASVNTHSAANVHQQARINDFNQRMSMARQLISSASSMASSGIYGAALGAMKHGAEAMAATAAHSGEAIAKHWNGKGNGSLISGSMSKEWDKLNKDFPYQF